MLPAVDHSNKSAYAFITMERMLELTETEVGAILKQRCREAGGQAEFARRFGVSGAYISYVIHGQKRPSKRLCEVLGLRQHIRHVYTWEQLVVATQAPVVTDL
jgi:hypothetical protein